jgi:hypothetical protein
MDGQRFDAWTRWFVRRISRRGAFKSVAGVALAAVGAGPIAATREAEANTGMPCVEYGSPCSPGECCAPHVCRSGYPTSICGDCLAVGELCDYAFECCSGICEFSFFGLWWYCQPTPSVSGGATHGRRRKKKKKKRQHAKDSVARARRSLNSVGRNCGRGGRSALTLTACRTRRGRTSTGKEIELGRTPIRSANKIYRRQSVPPWRHDGIAWSGSGGHRHPRHHPPRGRGYLSRLRR